MTASIVLKVFFALHFAIFAPRVFGNEILTLEHDLSTLPKCSEFFDASSSVTSYCLNGSTCRLAGRGDEYLEIVCDCAPISGGDAYYGGPRCENKLLKVYSTPGWLQYVTRKCADVSLKNTSWFEDLLGCNQWKNDFTRVGLVSSFHNY